MKNYLQMQMIIIVSSILIIIGVGYAFYTENISADWVPIQNQYKELLLKQAREIDNPTEREGAIKNANAYEIKIRQIVLDSNHIDRCITCHVGIDNPNMAGQPEPLSFHPPEVLENHPLDKFGCTVCHQGQPRSVQTEDAHGHLRWEQPILPSMFVQANCAICHDVLPSPNPIIQEEGKKLFSEANCIECHTIGDMGDSTEKFAPLNTVGLKMTTQKWTLDHPSFDVPGVTPVKNPNNLSQEEINTLQLYLQGRHGGEKVAYGRKLFEKLSCAGCHKVRGRGGVMGPDLTEEGLKLGRGMSMIHVEGDYENWNWIFEHFIETTRVTPNSNMPRFAITLSDIDALTTFVLSLKNPDAPLADFNKLKKFAEPEKDGRELFIANCSACHGVDMSGRSKISFNQFIPGIGNADFLRIASDDFIKNTIAEGRSKRNMPKWKDNLTTKEIDKIVNHILDSRPKQYQFNEMMSLNGNPAKGKEIFDTYCFTCHGDGGKDAKIGPTLYNGTFLSSASREFIFATLMNGRINNAMPAWTTLSKQEIRDIIALLDSWRVSVPKGPNRFNFGEGALNRMGNTEKGAAIFKNTCAACHGSNGEGGDYVPLNKRVFFTYASNSYLSQNLQRCLDDAEEDSEEKVGDATTHYKKGLTIAQATKLANDLKSLSSDDVVDVISYMRSWNPEKLPVPIHKFGPHEGNIKNGEEIFNRYCMGCHGETGKNGPAPAIGEPFYLETVPDGYMIGTLTIGRNPTFMLPRGANAFQSTTEKTGENHFKDQNFPSLKDTEILDIISYVRSQQVIKNEKK